MNDSLKSPRVWLRMKSSHTNPDSRSFLTSPPTDLSADLDDLWPAYSYKDGTQFDSSADGFGHPFCHEPNAGSGPLSCQLGMLLLLQISRTLNKLTYCNF